MPSSPSDVSASPELNNDHDNHCEISEDVTLVNGDVNSLSDHIVSDELETLSLSEEDPELCPYTCPSCMNEHKQPRVLSCLHVFCESCLRPLLIEDCIACPTCKETTEVESISELPLDYVTANAIDMKGIEGMNMACTSCKAEEKAISRCSDCANFLCPNCVTAHQFMRCFENHKVVSFTDLTKGDGVNIHRPITCTLHDEEQPMKFFCTTCQIPICNECMMNDHQAPGHRYERISEIEQREVRKIKMMVEDAERKLNQCDAASSNLQQSLGDLESQRDDAKSLIKETFQSYKALLEKRQESLLCQLEEIHKQQELSVMEMFHEVNKTVNKIEHGSTFVTRILEKSNSLELLSLKKAMTLYMSAQLERPLGDSVSVDIEFVTDNQAFASAVTDQFGHFKLRDESVMKNQQQQQQMLQLRQMERQTSRANIANQSEGRFNMASPPALLAAAPPSYAEVNHMVMPPMLGSPDSGLCNEHTLPMRPIVRDDYGSGPSAFLPANNNPVLGGNQLGLRNASLTSMSGMNAGVIGDPASSRQSQSPTISDSGIGMDSSSPGISGNPASQHFNLATLARHGAVTLTAQGQVLVNDLALAGLGVNNNATGLQTTYTHPNRDMCMSTASSPDQDLHLSRGSSHGGMFSPPPLTSGRSMMPASGSTIEGVLSQRRESVSTNMASGGSGGGGSGFTSPSPDQYGGTPFPLRSKMSAMQIRHKFGSLGPAKVQFNSPHGFCMGFEEDIVVADTNNHRIQVFDKSGDFKYQFGVPGREEGQLWYPRKVAVMRGTSRYVICDRGNERSRMQIFSKNGHFVKKIAIRYIDIVAGLAITPAGNIVAVDSVSPTVFTIAESGDLIKWFDCSDYMREPSDIAVADKEYYVCDFKGHCVVVFNDDGQFLRRIGTDTITNFPNGIDISDAGDVLVGDSHGNRFHVAVFQRDGSLIGEFECPYVKVSRCCGLKITSEGYVVTLAKNNHHVLVLNTLYIS